MNKNLFLRLKKFSGLLLLILFIQVAQAQKRPSWTYNTPHAQNKTFTYRVEWGAGENIVVAYNQALTKVINSTANAIGVNTSTGAVKEALASGASVDVVSETLKIPFNKVCEFEENMGGGLYRVFVLCQAAKNANIKPQFVEFNQCYDKKEIPKETDLESDDDKAEKARQVLIKREEEARKRAERIRQANIKKQEEAKQLAAAKRAEERKKAYPKAFKHEDVLFNITKCVRSGNELVIKGLVQNQGGSTGTLTLQGRYGRSKYPKIYTNQGTIYEVTRMKLGNDSAGGNYLASGADMKIPSGVTLRFSYTFSGVSSSFQTISSFTFDTKMYIDGDKTSRSHSIKNMPVTNE